MRTLPMRFLILLLFLALAGGRIALAHMRYELSVQADGLRHTQQRLLMERKRLRIERASLLRPERLRALARKMGMAPPSPAQVVRL